MASARGPRKPTISSLAATRMQKRRSRWGHLQTRRWTKEEFRELLGHIQALGYDWVAIANIMGRSPDSLRNKLVRFHRSSIWKKREEARAWLKAVVLVLELEEPPYWGRADEAHIMEVDDIPAPAFRYRKSR